MTSLTNQLKKVTVDIFVIYNCIAKRNQNQESEIKWHVKVLGQQLLKSLILKISKTL